jgi:hypothetical protein
VTGRVLVWWSWQAVDFTDATMATGLRDQLKEFEDKTFKQNDPGSLVFKVDVANSRIADLTVKALAAQVSNQVFIVRLNSYYNMQAHNLRVYDGEETSYIAVPFTDGRSPALASPQVKDRIFTN